MATKRQRNDFINFILDTEGNKILTDEFLSKKTADELYSFFQEKKYKDIPYNDCEDIITATKGLRGGHIPDEGKTISPSDCPHGQKNY